MTNIDTDNDFDFDFDDKSADIEDSEIEEIPKEKRVLRTQAYDKSVADLVAMMPDDIRLDPDYQRNYIWDNKKASLLIESILLNVPIPVIYVEEEEDSTWNVVDGLQRLNSLKRFFSNEFKLTGLEVLSELNRLQFSTLNTKAQRVLKNGILRIIVILQESHPEIKYDIFLRLNRGSVRLNEQELRNCLYRGNLNQEVRDLRESEKLQAILGLTRPHPRFVDAELVLRSIALIERFNRDTGSVGSYIGKMKGFLNLFMNEYKNADKSTIDRFRRVFIHSLNSSFDIFGEKAFRRIDVKNRVADRQINRAIMDVIMVGFAYYDKKQIIKMKVEICEAFIKLLNDDHKFNESITLGTSDKPKLEYRLTAWMHTLKEVMS
ncbi:MAG: DUF262 domain-containing protein [Glaciimonas sp.]|nr:DUF262 domain-containing protein [Glaciimonas sp.]